MYSASFFVVAVFLSTPSGWRATLESLEKNRAAKFLSTPSGWRATYQRLEDDYHPDISIHALRVEGDQAGPGQRHIARAISIHALRVEGDPENNVSSGANKKFLSTPSGWRATYNKFDFHVPSSISIHALRVEGDSKNGQSFRLFLRKREKNLPL